MGFFLASIDFSSKLLIASSVREIANQYLDIDPLLLPLPPNTPPEFPHITMRNENNGWMFQMAPGRFDIIIEEPFQFQTYQNSAELIQGVSINILNRLISNFHARVNRVGLISTNITELENATEYIQIKYLNLDNVEDSEEVRLHYLHRLDVHSFHLNRWVRMNAVKSIGQENSRINLVIDINSRPEYLLNVDIDSAMGFFTTVNQLIRDVIHGYSE